MKTKTPKHFVNKRVFTGWINPIPEDGELPEATTDLSKIIFGNTRWRKTDRRCRITVEWQ